MKTLFKLMAMFMLLFGFSACGDDEEPAEQPLEVNYANLNGTWKLAEWNGEALPEGEYLYITFHRKERTYEIYQKFDSMYARLITGKFTVDFDDYLGYILSGKYDYQNGKWNHEYIVTDLLPSGSMTLTVKDNANDVQRFIRQDGVPASIKEEAVPEK